MDMSDIVEEDEQEFLKDAGQGFSFMKQAHSLELEGSVFDDDKPDVTAFGDLQEATSLPSEDDGQRKDSCLSAEPMKKWGNRKFFCWIAGTTMSWVLSS